MTACPIRYQRQVSDRKGKIFYTSITSLSHISKNAGIIAEKDFNKKYNEMLAIALARTDVELSSEVIGQYLFNTGYMAKSKYAKLGEIAQRASELRKER